MLNGFTEAQILEVYGLLYGVNFMKVNRALWYNQANGFIHWKYKTESSNKENGLTVKSKEQNFKRQK